MTAISWNYVEKSQSESRDGNFVELRREVRDSSCAVFLGLSSRTGRERTRISSASWRDWRSKNRGYRKNCIRKLVQEVSAFGFGTSGIRIRAEQFLRSSTVRNSFSAILTILYTTDRFGQFSDVWIATAPVSDNLFPPSHDDDLICEEQRATSPERGARNHYAVASSISGQTSIQPPSAKNLRPNRSAIWRVVPTSRAVPTSQTSYPSEPPRPVQTVRTPQHHHSPTTQQASREPDDPPRSTEPRVTSSTS